MSTFAVFGMTRDVALAEAKKKVKGTRKNLKAPGGVEPIPMEEWLALVEKKAANIMEGNQVRQLSVLFDAPQYAHQFIELARKTGKCRDMRIKSKALLVDEKGNPLKHPKTGAPRYGFREWHEASAA